MKWNQFVGRISPPSHCLHWPAWMLLVPLLFLPMSAVAELEGDYEFRMAESAAVITRYVGAGGSVTIPSRLADVPVTAIGYRAFYRIANVINVAIPGSVMTIETNGFLECTGLASVTMADGVTSVGVGAFASCTNLETVSLPGSVMFIGGGAFTRCSSLKTIALPEQLAAIDFEFELPN